MKANYVNTAWANFMTEVRNISLQNTVAIQTSKISTELNRGIKSLTNTHSSHKYVCQWPHPENKLINSKSKWHNSKDQV